MFVPFLLVYAAVLVTAAFIVARLARRLPRVAAVALVAGTLVLGVAFAPVPTHGGFLLPGPELVREALHDLQAPPPGPPSLPPDRFAGFLPDGAPAAFRDPERGLVWSESLDRITHASPAALDAARATCAARAPAGHWAVPSDAEVYLLARSGRAIDVLLAEARPAPGASIAVLAPPWRRPAPAGIDLRCVAVTQPATLRGYLPSDVPLAEWNAYQLGR